MGYMGSIGGLAHERRDREGRGGNKRHDGNTLKDYKAVGVERVEISRGAAITPTERLKDECDGEMPWGRERRGTRLRRSWVISYWMIS